MRFLQEVINDRHFDEKSGPNFVNIVDRDAIFKSLNQEQQLETNKPIQTISLDSPKKITMAVRKDRESLDSVSSISSSSSFHSRSRSPDRETYHSRSEKEHGSFYRNPYAKARSRSPVYRKRSRSPKRTYKSDSPPLRTTLPNRGKPFSMNIQQRVKEKPIEKKLLPSPKELSQQASEIANERYKWEKYRCLVEIAVRNLEKIQKEYEKNPEKHPLYPEEWKKFWNKRYKELQADKKDPTKHDFKPEWIDFWTRRMKELYEEDVENKKEEIRTKLGLPDESEEKTDKLKEQYKIINKRSPPPSEDDDCILQEDEDSHRSSSRRRSRSRSLSYQSRRSREKMSPERKSHRDKSRYSPEEKRRRSRSRELYYEKEPPRREIYYEGPHRGAIPPSHYSETYEQWAARYYGPYRSRSSVYVRNAEPKHEEEKDNQPLTVVSVLRLLTALEDHLGSLGPKVVDLLAKALALEKVKANSADELLLNDDNCVIFETVKEKLKGQLIADVIESNKIYAVKKAIKNIAELIHMINEKNKNNKEEKYMNKVFDSGPSSSSSSVPKPVSNDVELSKADIAKKIADSLLAQGKTDVTTEQLEVLINAYMAMVNSAKDKPVSTANYLKEMEQSNSNDSMPPTTSRTIEPSSSKSSTEKKSLTFSSELEKSIEKTRDENIDTNHPLESLTDSDLQTLLQNFKDLSSEEQQHLISYLKKLESSDPERVEKLRKFVNLATNSDDESPSNKKNEEYDSDLGDMSSSIASRSALKSSLKFGKFLDDPEDRRKFLDSDDDEDYSFDDVVKAASKNLNDRQSQELRKNLPDTLCFDRIDDNSQNSTKSNSGNLQSNSGSNISISDTKNLIANLMGSLQKNVASRTPVPSQHSNSNQIPSLPTHGMTQEQMAYGNMGQNHIQTMQPFYMQTQPPPIQQSMHGMPPQNQDFNHLNQYQNPMYPSQNQQFNQHPMNFNDMFQGSMPPQHQPFNPNMENYSQNNNAPQRSGGYNNSKKNQKNPNTNLKYLGNY